MTASLEPAKNTALAVLKWAHVTLGMVLNKSTDVGKDLDKLPFGNLCK